MRVKERQYSLGEMRELVVQNMCLYNICTIQGRNTEAKSLLREIHRISNKLNKAQAIADNWLK